ncbi:hypothetical protein AQJ64_04310 [Streptomyces griseoruber]|uniref:Uncharacterized protein n=1 Tax=Streptomyces griseoruber TaxID=1943 RepID=A0A101T9L6_9ACTN|nr:hypothetical protein AQJ64_04310 [Streptomyces griseoruber]
MRAAVHTDPHNVAISQFTPIAVATEADGGYRLTGKWPFASGSHQAQWTLTAFRVLDGAGEVREVRYALMSAADLTIEDTWYVAGTAGTAEQHLRRERPVRAERVHTRSGHLHGREVRAMAPRRSPATEPRSPPLPVWAS